MFYIKFCIEFNSIFSVFFLKIQATFYKHALNLKNWRNMRYNYLSIELLLNVLAIFFVEKKNTTFFFKFEIWNEGILVFWEYIEYILFHAFLKISLRKINILEKN